MKKIVGILLVVATLFSMVGCSKPEAKKADKQVLDVIISQYGNYTKEWWTEFEKNFEAANADIDLNIEIHNYLILATAHPCDCHQSQDNCFIE